MQSNVIKVFIGYDAVESVAWHTMAASIYRHSSRPVAIIPINLLMRLCIKDSFMIRVMNREAPSVVFSMTLPTKPSLRLGQQNILKSLLFFRNV